MNRTTLQDQLLTEQQQRIQRVRQEHETWLQQHISSVTHAVTLTFNKAPIRAYMNQFNQSLTMNSPEMLEQYSEALKRFGRALNRSLFGNAAQRHSKSILMVPVFEGLQKSKTPHIHIAVSVPDDRSADFEEKVAAAWTAATPFAGYTDTRLTHDNLGWSGYITKQSVFTDRQSIVFDAVMLPKS
ncbi:MAG: hypothetical protein CFE38_19140 [Comamonadaceae bacterium PBBC1]|nr:MAG: hypothetical protein CFE38_19140 [Comamonadaceae bacterium PBBC1]